MFFFFAIIILSELRISLQHASCVMHVDQTTDSVVEQDVEDFDLEGFEHCPLLRIVFVSSGFPGISILLSDLKKSNCRVWLNGERVVICLLLANLMSRHNFCYAYVLHSGD